MNKYSNMKSKKTKQSGRRGFFKTLAAGSVGAISNARISKRNAA